jgi:O-antigen/teichoic acid export membrane protein
VLAGYIFWAIFQIMHTSFYIKERTAWTSFLVGGAAIVNVVLNILLVPRYGYFGAAWVTLITFFILSVITYLASERIFPVHYELRRIVAPIALAAGLFVASLAIPEWPVGWVLLVKLGLLALFPVVLLLGGYLSAQEKRKIRAFARMMRRAMGSRRRARAMRGDGER